MDAFNNTSKGEKSESLSNGESQFPTEVAATGTSTTASTRFRPIPRDPQNIRKATRVIDAEFDLEILLRQQELHQIQVELEKAEVTLETLKNCLIEVKNGQTFITQSSSAGNSQVDFSHDSQQHQRGGDVNGTANINNIPSIMPTRQSTRKVVSTRDKDYLYFDPCRDLFSRRNDGTFVKLTCPECHRSRFINVQGFLNHCRLSHKIEFPNHEEALLLCGTPVDESIVPPDHPARSRIITRPPSLRSILDQKYDENIDDIELESEDIRGERGSDGQVGDGSISGSREASPTSPALAVSAEIHATGEDSFESDSDGESIDISAEISQFNKYKEGHTISIKEKRIGAIEDASSSSSPSPKEINLQKKQDISHKTSHSGLAMEADNAARNNEKEDNNLYNSNLNKKNKYLGIVDIEPEESGLVGEIISLTGKQPSSNNHNSSITSKTNGNHHLFTEKTTTHTQEITTISAVAFTTPSCGSVFDPIDAGSRFYVKRRIVIGNVSKWIPPEKREPKLEKYTHKWMVYVVGPPHSLNVTSFIRKVRFYLHPSYRPNDIVDLKEAPFQITRFGWGEFPVRVQLFFVDKKNKPVDVIHLLKLDETHSSKQRLGDERAYDLELDRNTEFMAPREEKTETNLTNGTKINTHPDGLTKNPNGAHLNSSSTTTSSDISDSLESLLNEVVHSYPIIRPNSESSRNDSLPYTTAPSTEIFLAWELSLRASIEWQRARAMRIMVQSISQSMADEKIQEAAASLTTKLVVLWCRKKKLTPILPDESDSTFDAFDKSLESLESPIAAQQLVTSPESFLFSSSSLTVPTIYCKYCGCPNSWHETEFTEDGLSSLVKIKCKRLPRALRKSGKLCGLTLASESIEELGKDSYQEEENMEMDIDIGNFDDKGVVKNIFNPNTLSPEDEESNKWLTINSMLDPHGIDWVWDVVAELEMKSVVATNISTLDDNTISMKDDSIVAVEQRLMTGNLLFQLTKIFLTDILNKSVEIYRDEENDSISTTHSKNYSHISIKKEEGERDSSWQEHSNNMDIDESSAPMIEESKKHVSSSPSLHPSLPPHPTKLLVPYHIYQAIESNPKTDFLTGKYLASVNSSKTHRSKKAESSKKEKK
ncbi:188_t:CDS:10 [Ambispora gerdemannii]|uniref:188_t:CDS:1 n=1 Tax=Ambispora gerdemannii TaxID=144530 RepID=A0A9N9FUW6_9GLOM|nr:188_t:CDS:10 [Ambispora gerdemannii]